MEGPFRILQGHEAREEVEDVLIWRLVKGGTFSVISLYSSLVGCHSKGFPTSMGWNRWVLMKVGFFAWKAIWEILLTLDQLKRRVGFFPIDVVCARL